MDDSNAILSGLVRLGTVRTVDAAKRMALVWFDDLGFVSDWLAVLHLFDAAACAGCDKAVAADRMPEIGALVLVLYLPVRDADGFILGGV
jgi:phage baseplate assembly protein gpV